MKRNRYLEAFKESFNIVGLAAAASASLALIGTPLMPIPILGALVLEAAYLLFVPDLKWYQQRLSRLHDADIQKRREASKAQVLPLLRPNTQERYGRMEQMLHSIQAQSQTDRVGQESGWFAEVIRKLDFLLDKFLQFAAREVQFREYLLAVLKEVREERGVLAPRRDRPALDVDSIFENQPRRGRNRNAGQSPDRIRRRPASQPVVTDPGVQNAVEEIQQHYDKELADLKTLREQEADEATRAILDKRLEVLRRRREFVGKIGKVLTNLNHQLMLLEDTFGLISDELRARPPEQVIADIDEMVWQTKTMTELLDEMASYESTLANASARSDASAAAPE